MAVLVAVALTTTVEWVPWGVRLLRLRLLRVPQGLLFLHRGK